MSSVALSLTGPATAMAREAGAIGFAVPAIPGVSAPGGAVPETAAVPVAESWAPDARAQIEVVAGNWGDADPKDIRVILDAVVREFRPLVAPADGETLRPLKIQVLPRGTSPRVLYQRGVEGEYVVQLTARDDRWFQYAYQFSHELCHILSNFDHKDLQGGAVPTGNQWFEEALCETASLVTLRRLATRWEARPPGRKWLGYGPMFSEYARHLLGESHRHLPSDQSFGQWLGENQAALRQNPYLREKNELVATLLLPLFERDPATWQAIAYLNPNPASAGKSFVEYLNDWQAACPPGRRLQVAEVVTLFNAGASGAVGQNLQVMGKKPPGVKPEVSGAAGPVGELGLPPQ